MGGYNSIEELKNDENIRNLIKEAINSVYEMQYEYHENVKEVTKIDVGSDVIGTNEVNSGGGVMIGSGKDGIKIKQSTNLQTEMQTMYYGNFLSKNDNPIVQLVSSDMVNMTEKDNSNKEMPNFYDPVYVMTMLGFNVKFAEFDFENNRIKYEIDLGPASDQIKEQNIQEYERMNDVQNEHKEHNKKYEVKRKYLLEIKDKLKELNEEYQKLMGGGKGKIKGSDVVGLQGEISIAQQNVDKDVVDLQNNKVVKEILRCATPDPKGYEKKEGSKDTKLMDILKRVFGVDGENGIPLDPKIEEKLNKVLNDKIYKENVEDLKNMYIEESKKAGVFEDDAKKQLNTNTIISLFNSALSQSSEEVVKKYGEEAVSTFSDNITDYLTSYNHYMQSVFLVIIKECLKDYSGDEDGEFVKKIKSEFGDYKYDDFKELKALDDKYRSDIDILNELYIRYQYLSDQFEKENPNITEDLSKLGKEIKKLTAELSSNDSTLALKYYEYYETEPITRELMEKINKDIDEKNKLRLCRGTSGSMDDYGSTDPNFNILRDESTKLFDAYVFSTQDMDYDMIQIQNNKAYQNNVKKVTEGLEKENDAMKSIKSQITDKKEYKDVYDEYVKDMYDVQKDYVTISEIVNVSKNQDLINLYSEYIKERDKYYNSITLETIVNYEDKEKARGEAPDKEDVKKLKELFKKYNNDKRLAEEYKKQYDEVKEKMKKRRTASGPEVLDEYEKYIEISEVWQKLRTVKINFDKVLDAYEDAITADYQYMEFEKLYNLLVSGYMADIKERILNIREKTRNIETNITRSTYNYAQNKISINGNLEDANLSQSNVAIQKMYDGFEKIIRDTDTLMDNDKKNKKTKDKMKKKDGSEDMKKSSDDESQGINDKDKQGFFKNHIIIILILLVAVTILFLVAVIFYKRKVNIADREDKNKLS